MTQEFVLDDVVSVLGPEGSLDAHASPGLPPAEILRLFKHMLFTRAVDERLVVLQRQGRIGFHIGSLGEEAAIIGSAAALSSDDWIWPCYREFGALLLRGCPLQSYLDNMFGNANDQVKGRQMPDHYTGRPYHFGSVSSPIGTQITQAVGFSWASRLRGAPTASLVYFGEGATSSAEFHNGMNFAGVYQTPTVFFCRNNGWAISVPFARQTASATVAQKAFAYGVRAVRVDGNDLLAVHKVTREAAERARNGGGPTLIEALTHRLSGHSTSDDPKAYRKDEDIAADRLRDPIPRLRAYVTRAGRWSEADEKAWLDEVEADLRTAIATAEKAPAPTVDTLFEDVYHTMPWHLAEQRAACERAPRATGHGGGH